MPSRQLAFDREGMSTRRLADVRQQELGPPDAHREELIALHVGELSFATCRTPTWLDLAHIEAFGSLDGDIGVPQDRNPVHSESHLFQIEEAGICALRSQRRAGWL